LDQSAHGTKIRQELPGQLGKKRTIIDYRLLPKLAYKTKEYNYAMCTLCFKVKRHQDVKKRKTKVQIESISSRSRDKNQARAPRTTKKEKNNN
jgi:hypothetical protein